jgi:hypothetical protein
MHRARVLEAVNASDVRMIEGGEQLRLSLEPRKTVRIDGKQLRQDLQRDVAIERRIARAIDLL